MNSKSNKQPRTNFSNLNLTETLITYLCRNFVGDLRCRKTLLEEDDEDGVENVCATVEKSSLSNTQWSSPLLRNSWNFVGDLRCRKTLLEEDDEDGTSLETLGAGKLCWRRMMKMVRRTKGAPYISQTPDAEWRHLWNFVGDLRCRKTLLEEDDKDVVLSVEAIRCVMCLSSNRTYILKPQWNFVGDLRCRKTLLEEVNEDGEENKGSSIYKPDARRGVKAFMVI
nr:hypothetical protein CFP56_72175 [Quercus suber]